MRSRSESAARIFVSLLAALPICTGSESHNIVVEFTCTFDTDLCPGWTVRGNNPNVAWTSTAKHTEEEHLALNVHHNSSILNETNFMYLPKGLRMDNDDIWTEISSQTLMIFDQRTVRMHVSFWYYLPVVYVTLTLRFREFSAPNSSRDAIHWMIRDRVHYSVPHESMRWYHASTSLAVNQSGWIVFRAQCSKVIDLIALDEVVVTDFGPAEISASNLWTKTMSCDFTTNFCGWSNMMDADFTAEHDAEFSYIVANHSGSNIHPVYRSRSPMIGSIPISFPAPLLTVFSFRYFLSGTGVRSLTVFLTEPYDYISVWSRNASSENVGRWMSVDLALCSAYGDSIQIRAIMNQPGAYVRLTDFVYHGELSGTSPIPHQCTGISCTFDTSFCGWSDIYSISSRWKRHSFLEDQTPKRPGLFDITASGTANVIVPVARLVSACIDIDQPAALDDGHGVSEGDKLVIKLFSVDYSERFVAMRKNNTIILPRMRAVRIVIEHYFLHGAATVARLPLLQLENESVAVKASDKCPDYPLEQVLTNYPIGTTVSCTFDRNLCGWINEGDQLFFVFPRYSVVLPHEGAGAAVALMVKNGNNKQFGPLRSPVIQGKGVTQIFFYYYMDSRVFTVTLYARSDRERKFLWYYDDTINNQDRQRKWLPARVSYCLEGNYTLELTVRFDKFDESDTGFWIDSLVLNDENLGDAPSSNTCNEGLSKGPITSVTCDATLLTLSTPAAFCGWQLIPNADATSRIESLEQRVNENSYFTLALAYRGTGSGRPVTVQLVSPDVQGGANQRLYLWFRSRQLPVVLQAAARLVSNMNITILLFTRNVTSSKIRWWYKEDIPLNSISGFAQITFTATFPTLSSVEALRQNNSQPDFAISHVWYPTEKGFYPGPQIDDLPAYVSCSQSHYRNVTCSFERSAFCSWSSGTNVSGWALVDGFFGSHPFVVPGPTSQSGSHYMAFNGTAQSQVVLQSDFIGPLKTRLRFSFFLFGPGVNAFRLYAESMSNYFLLWDAAESADVKVSARRWQDVELDLCVKFPFKLVFKIFTVDHLYVAALDEVRLLEECDVLTSNTVCPDLRPSSSFEPAPTKPTNYTVLVPTESANLTCVFASGSFCGWVPSEGDNEWSILLSPESNSSAVVVNCSKVYGVQSTSYLVSPEVSCGSSPDECSVEFRYKVSLAKVARITVDMRVAENESVLELFPNGSLYDSGSDEFPEWKKVLVNLSDIQARFWLIVGVTFFEDETVVELADLHFSGREDNNPAEENFMKDENHYYLLPLLGNLVGVLVIAAIVAALYLYRQRYSKAEYQARLTLCDVPTSLRKEFELPSSAITLLNHELSLSHFCRVGLARMALPHSKGSTKVSAHVAVKFLDDDHSKEEERCFLAEMATFMRAGKHTNIVNLVGVVLKGRPMIVMEYCANGSLHQYLLSDNNYAALRCGEVNDAAQKELEELLMIIYQVAAGMEFLSNRNILHRDLAARNVLLDGKLTAKINDFGLARAYREYVLQRSDVKLPLAWMPPETLVPMEGRYSDMSDVWSFGIVVWETFTFGQQPYSQQFPKGLQHDTLLNFLRKGNRLPLPDSCPDWMSNMVARCWSAEPKDRPAFSEIVSTMREQLNLSNSETAADRGQPDNVAEYVVINYSYKP